MSRQICCTSSTLYTRMPSLLRPDRRNSPMMGSGIGIQESLYVLCDTPLLFHSSRSQVRSTVAYTNSVPEGVELVNGRLAALGYRHSSVVLPRPTNVTSPLESTVATSRCRLTHTKGANAGDIGR